MLHSCHGRPCDDFIPPVLVTPPASVVVPLSDLKDHLRTMQNDLDDLITSLETAAVGYLDGWTGVLGRAILPQVWQQDYRCWGALRVAMPDASAIKLFSVDDAGVETEIAGPVVRRDGAGALVIAPQVDGRPRLHYSCALPDARLPVAQTIVKMLVAHWYRTPEAVADTSSPMSEVPLACSALIDTLRWRSM